jgi:dipeptidyl aminopeptidase/acylaminoacyl peptidase
MKNRPSLAIVALLTLWALPAAAQRSPDSAKAPTGRPITETDLFKFVWVADPQISPDGRQIAFVRVSVDEKGDQYDTSIWLARSDASEPPRRLTGGTRDQSPRWSPDGARLAFARSTERDGKTQPPQIYVMPMGGGEPRGVTDLPRGAANPVWSPDSRTIAFSSGTKPEDVAEAQKTDKDKPRQSDVRVITEAVYRANGVAGFGYVDPDRPAQIWTVDVSALTGTPVKPTQITTGEFASVNHQWSSDGARLYFVSNRVKEPYYHPDDSDLYAVAKGGGTAVRVLNIDGRIGAYSPSPDGKRIAFVGTLNGRPERSYDQPDLFVADLSGGEPRNLTATYDFDVNGGIGGDQRAPRGQHPAGPIWIRKAGADCILIKTGHQGDTRLVAFDASSGEVRDSVHLTRPREEVMSYTVTPRSEPALAAVVSTPTTVGDLYFTSGSAKPVKLTSFNDELFGQLTMNEPEEIWYTSFDGKKIQGWILKPPAFDASKKYPLIVQIHGGPHAAYGNTFTHEFQWMAAKGYVVLYTNPRGSSNYGQDFGNVIQYNYPGDDYKDIMAGVDEVLKKGYVDEARMGVTGGSGGGLLTNWTVTQTTRFKAAVSQRDISDWANFWYTADFALFNPFWFRKAPFEDPADFARRSPITHVAKIQTPLMFILGDEDWRTPPAAGGEELFRALKYLKRPTVMVRFPNENHELSRSGKPWHRVERLQHIVGWFDKWLLGKQTSTY